MVRIQPSPRRDLVRRLHRPLLLAATIIASLTCVGFYHANLSLEQPPTIVQHEVPDFDVYDIPATEQPR